MIAAWLSLIVWLAVWGWLQHRDGVREAERRLRHRNWVLGVLASSREMQLWEACRYRMRAEGWRPPASWEVLA